MCAGQGTVTGACPTDIGEPNLLSIRRMDACGLAPKEDPKQATHLGSEGCCLTLQASLAGRLACRGMEVAQPDLVSDI
jgi:hypothetical protein